MTPDHMLQVLADIRRQLASFAPVQWPRDKPAGTRSSQLCHAHWMAREAITFLGEGRVDKANRWLGFIQGLLFAHDVQTIEAMAEANGVPT